ncbi:hypothetical protein C5O80_31370 [Burkholderia sp. SRS-46]|nr:hypothetical protein C5O80_31370 [Burkholderia sp. SRS-46]
MSIQNICRFPAEHGYGAMKIRPTQRQAVRSATEDMSSQVSISGAARDLMNKSQVTERRLAEIKAMPALNRTADDMDFLMKNDKRLAQIYAKDEKYRTAEEVDYVQKSVGFVNTMAGLSSDEKALYDELIARGNWDAAKGLQSIGMARITVEDPRRVTLPDGRVINLTTTSVSAQSVRNIFSLMTSDKTGLEALAAYLDQRASMASVSGKPQLSS